MFAQVYRLRERGVKLPRPKPAVAGQLSLQPHAAYRSDPGALLAKLMHDVTSDALPPLHKAVVRRITPSGLLIAGVEVIARRAAAKSSEDHYRQTWWCLVFHEPAVDVLPAQPAWARAMSGAP